MELAIGLDTFIGVIGGLIGFVALIYINSARREMDQMREENSRLSNELSETNGRLSVTREDMVSRKEFNGAVNRLYVKMNNVDKRVVLFLAQLSAKKANGRRTEDGP